MAHVVKRVGTWDFVALLSEDFAADGHVTARYITTTRDPQRAAQLSDDQAARLCDRSFRGEDLTGAAGAARREWERVNT